MQGQSRPSRGVAGWFGFVLKRRLIATGVVLAVSWVGTQAGLLDSNGAGDPAAVDPVEEYVNVVPVGWVPSAVDGLGWAVVGGLE